MPRTFAFLAASLGLLVMTGCGEVKGGGVAVSQSQTAALQPIPPALEDRDLKLAPPPLVPAPLPKIDPNAAPATADGGQPLQDTGPTAPAEQSNYPIRITLSGASVKRIDKDHVHFETSYVFSSGEPARQKSYDVVVTGKADTPSGHMQRNNSFWKVKPQGTFARDVEFPPQSPTFQLKVIEHDPRGPDHEVSNTVEVAVQQSNIGGSQPAGGPANAPPAAGGGGLLQSLFGNGSAPKAAAPNAAAPNTQTPATPAAGAAGAAPADAPVRITLSNGTIQRVDKNHIAFRIDYTFTSGQPNPKGFYRLVITSPKDDGHGFIRRDKTFVGNAMRPQGKFSGVMDFGGQNPDFQFRVVEFVPPLSEHDVSDVLPISVGGARKPSKERPQALRPAAVGDGAQGQGYGAGLITTPVSAYFAAKQMIVFNIQLPKAMQLFKAVNNRNPSSQAEFDEKIIKESAITLPELPAGETYVYDPGSGELMVRHPAK